MKKWKNEDASLDMTPMIDVVFQLIIFFVVTLKMTDNSKTEIKLEDGVHGIVLNHEELPPSQLTIDVVQKGKNAPHYTISNFPVNPEQIKQKVAERYRRYGDFPCMIRADWKTQHKYVREVTEACLAGMAEAGKKDMPILSFVAIDKAGDKKKTSLAGRWDEWDARRKKRQKK